MKEKTLRYLLNIYDEEGNEHLLKDWSSLTPFPRFEKGDVFDAAYIDQRTDSGNRFVVTNAEYVFFSGEDFREIELSLRVKLKPY